MKIKCSVKFRLETRYEKNNNGKQLVNENVPIILFFNFDGKVLRYYTGYRIDRNKWDNETGKVKRNVFNKRGESATTINNHLLQIANHVTEIYNEQKGQKKNPSVPFIRDELKKRLGEIENNPVSIINYYDEFVKTESHLKTWAETTIKKFDAFKEHFEGFYKTYKFDFDNIDEIFFQKFIDYLKDNLKQRNTTIAKHLKLLKWFLNWTVRKKYNTNVSFRDFKIKLTGTNIQKVIFLTWPELMTIYEKDIQQNYLRRVRDVFCFLCFTGLRYSDVLNLKKSDIRNNIIEITTIKTIDPLQIDLNDYSRAILDKYKDEPFPGNKALPVISNVKFNLYLKKLGALCKLNDPETIVYFKGNERKEETFQKWQLLTTHTGRKTFVSNALFLNIPSEVVMAWTGHKDHKVMEKYYKIVAPQKRREMAKFNVIENGKTDENKATEENGQTVE